jgi:hypothetical protein
MNDTIPPEADWDQAPSLLDGAMTLDLSPSQCNLQYWLGAVPQGTLRGRVFGHAASTPGYIRRPGPLRDALLQELSFRSIAEEKATRAISYLVALAPDNDCMEFYATQLIDEARHAMVFRNHLLDLDVAPGELWQTIDRVAGADRNAILVPVEELGLEILADQRDFIGGVLVLTVLVEGVLAPAAEMSERKWRPLDLAAAEIERGAGIDEIRHLIVGSAIVRDHLTRHPGDRDRLLQLIARGRRLWERLPVVDHVHRREQLFQEGMQQHSDVIGDYEIWDGRRMIETTAEERMRVAEEWSGQMQETRLAYMGLKEAIQ